MPNSLLIIAGSDPSGGAGIQADIKTATAHKIHSSCVITALTAQNTKKVTAIHAPPANFLQKQLETLATDTNFDVIKIGMLATTEAIETVNNFFINPRYRKEQSEAAISSNKTSHLTESPSYQGRGKISDFGVRTSLCAQTLDTDLGIDASQSRQSQSLIQVTTSSQKGGCNPPLNLQLTPKIILDPVMVSTSGHHLLEKSAIRVLKKLAKQAYLITPNIDEAEILANQKIQTIADMKTAAKKIQKLGAKNVLIKGGHLKPEKRTQSRMLSSTRLKRPSKSDPFAPSVTFSMHAPPSPSVARVKSWILASLPSIQKPQKITNLLLTEQGYFHQIVNKRIKNQEFHGTGCTLATAIAANLAKGYSLTKSTKKANKYVAKALKYALEPGQGAKIPRHFVT